MDPISHQLYTGAKRLLGLITVLVVILINWEPISGFEPVHEEEVMDLLLRYMNALGEYLISSQWPILSLVCYLSAANDLFYLRCRLLSSKVWLASGCGYTIIAFIVFNLVSLYKWFWLLIGLGVPTLVKHVSRPDFASTAIIIMTTCFACYVMGACEMKQIYLRQVSDAHKKRTTAEATTAV